MSPTFGRRLGLMRAYLSGAPRVRTGPFWMGFETTVRCNLRSPMCPRTDTGLPQADMPDAVLLPAIEESARLGCEHVFLYGFGEPLLDDRIFDLLSRCRALGLSTTMSTNGTLLDAERRRRLLDAGADHVIVSLDGATRETYDYYRAGGQYDRVVENVRALAAEKSARGSRMTLVVQMIRMRRNAAEQEAFVDAWSGVPGVDRVRLKEEDVGLSEHAMHDGDRMRHENPCHLLWLGPLAVRYTGDVYPCARMLAANAHRLGRIGEIPLEALWNAPEMQELRRLHAGARWDEDPVCAACRAARPALPLILAAMVVPTRIVQRWLPVAERISLRMRRIR